MRRFGFIGILALAGAITGATAFAADTDHDGKRGHGDHKADFAAFHLQMCKDHYARAVGRTAYLEAKLTLTPEQQSLFGAWKDSVLSSAQSRETACESMQRPDGRPDAIARMNHEETRLQARLASLQTELPPLTALYQSLSPEQKRAFDHMGGHHHGMGGHGMHGGHGMWMHGNGDGAQHDQDGA
jgi:hypothetical protein